MALIPLALRGVKFRALSAAAVLRRNLLIYGVGGLIAPFIGIKLIDMRHHGAGSEVMVARQTAQLGPHGDRAHRSWSGSSIRWS